MSEVVLRGIWMELEAVLRERPQFTGQIVLHCERGAVRKYAVTEVRRSQLGAMVVQDARPTQPPGPRAHRGVNLGRRAGDVE